MGKRKATKPMSGGVEGMLDMIAQRRHAAAARDGKVWCGMRGLSGSEDDIVAGKGKDAHPPREPGKACPGCVHRVAMHVAFWRTMGIRNEREMP